MFSTSSGKSAFNESFIFIAAFTLNVIAKIFLFDKICPLLNSLAILLTIAVVFPHPAGAVTIILFSSEKMNFNCSISPACFSLITFSACIILPLLLIY